MKTVQLALQDPNARGVVSRDGKRRYDANAKGVVEVPATEAPALLATPLASRYTPRYACGAPPQVGYQQAYEAWLAAHPDHPWLSYADWYRRYGPGAEEVTGNVSEASVGR